MKIKLLTKLTIAISAIFISSQAVANSYVDINGGFNTSWNSTGLNANIGYLFNQYIGIEGGFTTSLNNDYYLYDAAIKGILPLSQVFSLYGKLGLGINNSNYSNTGLLFGGGIQLNLSRQWSLHVEDYTVTGSNPNFLMFGGEFRF